MHVVPHQPVYTLSGSKTRLIICVITRKTINFAFADAPTCPDKGVCGYAHIMPIKVNGCTHKWWIYPLVGTSTRWAHPCMGVSIAWQNHIGCIHVAWTHPLYFILLGGCTHLFYFLGVDVPTTSGSTHPYKWMHPPVWLVPWWAHPLGSGCIHQPI